MTKICNSPYSIHDLTKKFDTLFMTGAALNIIYSLIDSGNKKLLKNIPSSRLEDKNYTLFMAKIDTLFLAKTVGKPYL